MRKIFLIVILGFFTNVPSANAQNSKYQDAIWAKVRAHPGALTAKKAAENAQRMSPEVAIAEAEVEVSDAQTRQTLSRYVPNVSLTGSVRRSNAVDFSLGGGGFSVGAQNQGPLQTGACPGGGNNCVVDAQGQPVLAIAAEPFDFPRNSYTLEASLSVPFSDYVLALSPARKGADANERSALLNRDAARETAGTNGKIAYYDWIKAQAQLAIAEEALLSSEARLRDARIALAAEILTSTDVLALETLRTSSQSAVAQARSFLILAEQNLRMTAQLQGPLKIGEDLKTPVKPLKSLGTLKSLIERAQSHRSEIRALDKSRSATQYAIEGTSANLYPRLDGVASYTYANPNQAYFLSGPEWNGSWVVGLNLSWSLNGYLSTKAQVRQYTARTRLLEAQRVSMLQGIEMEVRSAWEEWQRADAVATISESEMRSAEALHAQRVILFQGGEATTMEIIEAELQRSNATLRKIMSSIDKRIALARMERAAALSVEKDS